MLWVPTSSHYAILSNFVKIPIYNPTNLGTSIFLNIAGLAEFESRLLSERISHGTEYYRSNLKYFGKPPFGYTKGGDGKCTPHPTDWAIAEEIIHRLYTNSFASISR